MTPDESSESQATPDPVVPPVTDELRERARESPNSWIYSVDRAYDAEGTVPPYAILGAWPVDAHGELGAFTANVGYRPSPAALHLDAPIDAVDTAVQLAATMVPTVRSRTPCPWPPSTFPPTPTAN